MSKFYIKHNIRDYGKFSIKANKTIRVHTFNPSTEFFIKDGDKFSIKYFQSLGFRRYKELNSATNIVESSGATLIDLTETSA